MAMGDPYDLSGRVAVVTGGASGIGRAVSRALAKRGASIAVLDIAEEAAGSVAEILEKDTAAATTACTTNVVEQASMDRAIQAVVAQWGRVDILVTCAGVLSATPLSDLDSVTWNRLFDVNVRGTLNACLSVREQMALQGWGRIVTVGSVAATGSACNLPFGGGGYSATKAAVQGLTRFLAWELAAKGVVVNCVAPGPTHTPMHEEGSWEAAVQYYTPSVPAGRMAEPEDVADVIAFLCTDAARFVVGQTIHVNGGQVMAE